MKRLPKQPGMDGAYICGMPGKVFCLALSPDHGCDMDCLYYQK